VFPFGRDKVPDWGDIIGRAQIGLHEGVDRRVAPCEFDGIAWGALPGLDDDENPTCHAAELIEAGNNEGAYKLLMEALGTDLRCFDAHAHLGNLKFDWSAKRAMVHYEIGVRIGELLLPDGFEGLLIWGRIHNRPFLRCPHGYGLCLLQKGEETEGVGSSPN